MAEAKDWLARSVPDVQSCFVSKMKEDVAALFAGKLAAALADETFVRLVLSNPSPGLSSPPRISGRCVELRGDRHLSLTFHHPTKDVTHNQPAREAAAWVQARLGSEFRAALLSTTRRDWQYSQSANSEARVIGHPPSQRTPPPRHHDRKRHSFLDDSARDWLNGLGVCAEDGRVRPAMGDKFSQIQRYLEVLSHLLAECGWNESTNGTGNDSELVIADMGSGKGYLTFGTWHLFHRVRKRRVRVLGIEERAELVQQCNALSTRIAATGLEFTTGHIESVSLPKLDGLIALHACNTATDDAIRRGVLASARLILVAPCCHQELRPQIQPPEVLAPILRHGIMEERMAEWLTDGLRALYLEAAGYQTKLFEFVGSEHTPKNLMLSAVRRAKPAGETGIAREKIHAVKSYFGIKHHALDAQLEELPP